MNARGPSQWCMTQQNLRKTTLLMLPFFGLPCVRFTLGLRKLVQSSREKIVICWRLKLGYLGDKKRLAIHFTVASKAIKK